jgi:hypothetical protein
LASDERAILVIRSHWFAVAVTVAVTVAVAVVSFAVFWIGVFFGNALFILGLLGIFVTGTTFIDLAVDRVVITNRHLIKVDRRVAFRREFKAPIARVYVQSTKRTFLDGLVGRASITFSASFVWSETFLASYRVRSTTADSGDAAKPEVFTVRVRSADDVRAALMFAQSPDPVPPGA